MTDKKSRYSTDEKVRIVLQTLNPQASMAEICREHNLAPRTVYGWKEKWTGPQKRRPLFARFYTTLIPHFCFASHDARNSSGGTYLSAECSLERL